MQAVRRRASFPQNHAAELAQYQFYHKPVDYLTQPIVIIVIITDLEEQ